jgi:hypothetical protein
MKSVVVIVLAGLVAAIGAGSALAAKPVQYAGTTERGSELSFQRTGNVIHNVSGTLETTCVPATSGSRPPYSGAERFMPPGSFQIGRTYTVAVSEEPTLHYGKVKKFYRLTFKKTPRGLAGVLHVNYSFNTIGYSSASGGMKLVPFVCVGDDSFVPA